MTISSWKFWRKTCFEASRAICSAFSRFQFGGKVLGKSFRSFGLNGRKGWWVVEYDFHGNF